jgi:SAM-dependent methyltransferase
MRTRAAGDFDYEARGSGYAVQRRTDPRIAALVQGALGDAATVVNVGAGAGSYGPEDRDVTAVEPSASMRGQRPAQLAPAVDAVAGDLPFADDSFDAAMATITIHQWPDPDQGLRELRRVSRGPVVVLTFDGDALQKFWLAEYAPALIAAERLRFPAVRQSQSAWGFVDPAVADRSVARLRDDLESGTWDRRFGALRSAPEFTGSLRLITARPG